MPAPLPENAERRFFHSGTIATRWGDMDALGHVNNAVYLTYLETVRTQWVLSLPGHAEMWTKEIGPVVAHAAVTYKRPIVFPAVVRIDLYAEAPRRSSQRLHYEFRVEGDESRTVYATAETTLVWVDYATGRPISLPEGLRSLWKDA